MKPSVAASDAPKRFEVKKVSHPLYLSGDDSELNRMMGTVERGSSLGLGRFDSAHFLPSFGSTQPYSSLLPFSFIEHRIS